VIVPVYNKIRLRFLDILDWLTPIDGLFLSVFPAGATHEWDVTLMLSNNYKTEVLNDISRAPELKESILSAHHPRFWWRAVLFVSGRPVVEMLFDATGLARSLPLTEVVWLSESFSDAIAKDLSDRSIWSTLRDHLPERLLIFLRDSLVRRTRPFNVS